MRRFLAAVVLASLCFAVGYVSGVSARAPRPAVAGVIGADIPARAPGTSLDRRTVDHGLPGVHDRAEPDPLQQAGAPDESLARGQGRPASVTDGASSPLDAPSAEVRGLATWYAAPRGHAAAGPALRTGDWRGRSVQVCAGDRCIVTALRDWCACGPRHGTPTLLDLPRVDFARLADPSRGVLRVTVSRVFLPATDR